MSSRGGDRAAALRMRRAVRLHLQRLRDEGVWGVAVPEAAVPEAAGASRAEAKQPAVPRATTALGADITHPVKPAAPPSGDVTPQQRVATGVPSPRAAELDVAAASALPQARSPAASRPLEGAFAGPLNLFAEPFLGDVPGEGDENIEEIEAAASGCTLCRLSEGRTNVVFGVGNPDADLMFIGEAPGRDEDLQGEPFVGRAGQLLDRIIVAMGLRREDVYIANANKCRPPKNRSPRQDEIDACRPFLMRQVAAIRPRVIVLLGRVAVQSVLGRSDSLSRLRGAFLEWQGIPTICTYHPAYLLRNPSAKRYVWEDMKMVMALLEEES